MIYQNPQILPVAGWPHHELNYDWRAQANTWREVSAEFNDEMLGVVPPIYSRGVPGFMVSEPICDDDQGRTVYCALVHYAGGHFARYLAREDFGCAYSWLADALRPVPA